MRHVDAAKHEDSNQTSSLSTMIPFSQKEKMRVMASAIDSVKDLDRWEARTGLWMVEPEAGDSLDKLLVEGDDHLAAGTSSLPVDRIKGADSSRSEK